LIVALSVSLLRDLQRFANQHFSGFLGYRKFLQHDNLLNGNSVLIVLRRTRGSQLDESDLAAALDAAKRASGIIGPF
jgi:hypothetical protein